MKRKNTGKMPVRLMGKMPMLRLRDQVVPQKGISMNDGSFPKLFVTDLDGTALGGGYQPYARFPDPFSEFLDRLSARGCRWAISTTWDVAGQHQAVLASAVKSRPAFFIAEMSCRIARLNNEVLEFVQPYTADTEAKVLEACQTQLFALMKGVCGNFSPYRMNFYGHWFDFSPLEQDRERLAGYVRANFPEADKHLHLFVGGGVCAYPKILEKGRGVREVLRLTGIAPEQVVIAGDSMSGDGSMMNPTTGRWGVCPSNAEETLKAHVLALGGAVGQDVASRGVIQAFKSLAEKQGWEF